MPSALWTVIYLEFPSHHKLYLNIYKALTSQVFHWFCAIFPLRDMSPTFLENITEHYCHSRCRVIIDVTQSQDPDWGCSLCAGWGATESPVCCVAGAGLLCSVPHVSPPHRPHLTSQAFLVSRPRPSIDQQTLAWAHTSPAPGLLSNLPHSNGIKISTSINPKTIHNSKLYSRVSQKNCAVITVWRAIE